MLALLLPLLLLSAHPLHTTHTDVVEQDGQVTLQVRAFTDDLTAAVRKRMGAVDDSAFARYVRGTVTVTDAAGRALTLAWLGKEVQGDITLLRFRAAGLTAVSGASIRQAMHMEEFSDQVNVVQAKYAGRQQSFLFTPGDPARRFP